MPFPWEIPSYSYDYIPSPIGVGFKNMKALKEKEYLWSFTIVQLVINVLISLVPFFVRNDLFQKVMLPFVAYCLYAYDYSFKGGIDDVRIFELSGMVTCLAIAVFAMLDILLPPPNDPVGNENDQNESGSNGNSGGSGGIRATTIFFVLIMWLYEIISGINDFNNFKDSGTFTPITYLFNNYFYRLTYQFAFSMVAIYDDPPAWLYFIYVMPQAILYPLSSIISYFCHKDKVDDMQKCQTISAAFARGAAIYIPYFLFFKSQQHFTSDITMKQFQVFVVLIAYVWITFCVSIGVMGNSQYYPSETL